MEGGGGTEEILEMTLSTSWVYRRSKTEDVNDRHDRGFET